ncbi:MAG: autotransporter domain-containing protein [Alphaproteobacteria bacterium]
MSNTKHLADLLKVCSILPALAIMPAMADLPNTTGNAWVFGDLNLNYDTANNSAIGGRVSVLNGERGNDFPNYNIVGRSVSLTGTEDKRTNVYVGPVNMTLRELQSDEAFVYNWQKAGTAGSSNWDGEDLKDGEVSYADFDIAKENNILWGDDIQTVMAKNGWTSDEYLKMAAGLSLFANRDITKTAGALATENVDLTLDGTKVAAGSVTLSKSTMNVVKLGVPANILNGVHNASDGVSKIVADKFTAKDNSRILVGAGAELDLTGVKDALFTNNVITGNNDGAAINVAANGTLKIDGATFTNNDSHDGGGYGGAIWNKGSADIKNAVFSNNVAVSGGAVGGSSSSTGVLSVSGGTFTNNHARDDGGAIAAFKSLKITDSLFENNTAMYLPDEDGEYTVKQSTDNNPIGGGALALGAESESEIASISGTTFKNNRSGHNGGAIGTRLAQNTDDEAAFNSNSAKLDVAATFIENFAENNGGAIYNTFYTDNDAGKGDGVTVSGVFTGNKAGNAGGAIFNDGALDANKKGAVMTVKGATFDRNVADNSGGAIYNTGALTIENSDFSGNKSISGNGEGGAIYNQGDVKIAKAEFEDNKASVYGGAISNRATMTIQDAKFEENISYGDYGGALYNSKSGNIETLDADFSGNKTVNEGFAAGGAIANIGKIGDVNAAFGGNTVNASGEGASAKGGAIYTYAGSTIDSLVADFINNQAYSDGESIGGAVVNDGKIAKLHQAGKGFISNTSEGVVDGWAGALYNSEKAVISDLAANFASNTVTGGAQAFGGALVNKGTIEGLSGTFVNNVAVATSRDGKAFGGAIYNEGIINFVDDVVFSGNVANGSANDIHNLGTLNITDGTTTFGGGVSGNGTLTLAQGATLDIGTSLIHQDSIDLYGTVKVSLLNAGNDDKRAPNYGKFHSDDITVDLGAKFELSVGAVGTYNIWGAAEVAKDQVFVGDIYEIAEMDANGVRIVTKSVDEIAETVGISTQAAGAVAGLANANSGKAHQVSLALQEALNAGDAEYVERETKKLNPTDKPVAQAAATSVQNQVLALTAGRMAGGVPMGRAGGDESSQENGFWIQGLFNKSKMGDDFHGYTRGVALGADTLIDRKWTIGGGLATNNSDVHADGSHTDIDSKTVFLYGQYKPNNWFVNATATYNMAEYTEHKNSGGIALMDTYDVDSYGVQVMTGYDFTPGITTEAGVRYLNVSQDAYTQESGFQVGAVDTKFLSGVAGLKYAFAIENDWAIQLRPELRAAATYDFVSDDAYATVVMPGVASYQVETERLSRMGGEFGIGLTAQYKGMEVSLMYDLDLHRDYTSQTGMIKFRGRF